MAGRLNRLVGLICDGIPSSVVPSSFNSREADSALELPLLPHSTPK
jgi:hypothetical protein